MERSKTFAGIVRDFILLVTGAGEHIAHHGKHLHRVSLGGLVDGSAVSHPGESCQLLVHERVCRYMFWRHIEKTIHRMTQRIGSLPGKAEYQIKADIAERPPEQAVCLDGIAGRMSPAYSFQFRIHQRLHSHADTVYACSAPCGHLVLRHIVGIYLDSKFPRSVRKEFRQAGGEPQELLNRH